MNTQDELGSYYATAFTNAGAVSEERLGEVAVKLQAFHENLKQLRAAYQKKPVNRVSTIFRS